MPPSVSGFLEEKVGVFAGNLQAHPAGVVQNAERVRSGESDQMNWRITRRVSVVTDVVISNFPGRKIDCHPASPGAAASIGVATTGAGREDELETTRPIQTIPNNVIAVAIQPFIS